MDITSGSGSATRPPMIKVGPLLPPDDHDEMKRLAGINARGVGEEYRAAIADWISRHRTIAVRRAEKSEIAERVR